MTEGKETQEAAKDRWMLLMIVWAALVWLVIFVFPLCCWFRSRLL
jgi:heme/copper-type cytochrome/quinol oxidase subunit 2